MFLAELTSVPSGALPIAALRDHLLMGSGFPDDGAQDAMLEQYLHAALSRVEDHIGKALLTRRFVWTIMSWQRPDCQRLPLAPISEILAIRLVEPGATTQVIATDRYVLEPDRHRPILRAKGTRFPHIGGAQSIEIEFDAGFGAAWADVPAELRQAVLMLAADLYENRQGGRALSGLPSPIERLLAAHREPRLGGGRLQ